MDTLVLEKRRVKIPIISSRPVAEPKKKSFEEAIAECDGRPASEFFDELRRQVKEYYRNA